MTYLVFSIFIAGIVTVPGDSGGVEWIEQLRRSDSLDCALGGPIRRVAAFSMLVRSDGGHCEL